MGVISQLHAAALHLVGGNMHRQMNRGSVRGAATYCMPVVAAGECMITDTRLPSTYQHTKQLLNVCHAVGSAKLIYMPCTRRML
jgi:hypothetical protein